MRVNGRQVFIRPLTESDADMLLNYTTSNKEFLQPFEPIRPDSFFTIDGQRQRIETGELAFSNGTSYPFGIFEMIAGKFVGRIELSGVARGPFQNANLGYSIDKEYNGKGYATEAVRLILDFAFNHIELHRVQAGTLTSNLASIMVLRKNGFRHEGLAERYLKINGVWQDHNLFAITYEDWCGREL